MAFWGLFGDLLNKHVFFKIILLAESVKMGVSQDYAGL